MSDRTISVKLQAEIAGFKRAMDDAAQSTDRLGAGFDANGKKIESASGRIVRSAQINRQEWTTAGTALTAFGAGITAIGVAALKTGIEYNTLQQTSRAALTTLTGSAENANAQMDKLDDFARNSPFAKQVFIQAQQQMLGFGIEAEKVIPYLDSIQNAVAAFGGSNADIASIAEVFSKIQAQGKITARELMQLGTSGIDAATLIGDSMGKTAEQIRSEITAGTLDASVALDALASGMDTRFGGAADNVKETFVGAMDRVKAAWRDLSSELAEPLVGSQGGGLLVDLANDVADLMRKFQALPEPIKAGTTALVGMTGAGALAAGSFLLLLPRIIDTVSAFKTLNAQHGGAASSIGKYGVAATVTFAGVIAMIDAAKRAGQEHVDQIGVMTDRWRELDAQGLGNLVGDLQEYDTQLQSTIDTDWSRMINPVTNVQDAWRSLGRDRGLIETREAIVDIEVASANTTSNLLELREETGLTFDELKDLAELNGVDLTDPMGSDLARLARDRVIELAEGVEEATEATEAAEIQVISYNDALRANIAVTNEAAGFALNHREALSNLEDSFDKAAVAIKANGKTLDLTTEKGRENDKALRDIASAGNTLMESMLDAGSSTFEMRKEMVRARDEFVKSAKAAGATTDEAEDLADAYGLIPSNVGVTITTNTGQAIRNVNALRDSLNSVQWSNYNAARSAQGRADGGPIGFAGGGTIPGSSPHPRADNILIAATAGEYMQPVAAVNYWGLDTMEAIRQRDSEALWRTVAAKGLADGGSVTGSGAGYYSAPASQMISNVSHRGGDVNVTQHIGVASSPEAAGQATVRYLEMAAM